MNEKFLLAIQKIDQADQDQIVRQILEIFSSITTMNKADVIAAYQTIRFFINKLGAEDERRHNVKPITDAVVSRMLAIVTETRPQERVGIAMFFAKLVETSRFNGVFHDILKTLDNNERYYGRK